MAAGCLAFVHITRTNTHQSMGVQGIAALSAGKAKVSQRGYAVMLARMQISPLTLDVMCLRLLARGIQ